MSVLSIQGEEFLIHPVDLDTMACSPFGAPVGFMYDPTMDTIYGRVVIEDQVFAYTYTGVSVYRDQQRAATIEFMPNIEELVARKINQAVTQWEFDSLALAGMELEE